MCLFTGDNLGANSTLGYVESFSANYYCRICKEHKKVMQKQTISNPLMRRNVINYNADLTINNSTETGIKSECIFNELRSFHVVENIHVDIMHDLDEGVWKETMTCVINILIERKRFDIDTLNNLIQGFYYGPSEQRNKPPLITKDHNQRIKLAFSASEMRCFIRYFGLMVGHLIFDNDADIWKLYQTARHIIDILTAPFISITALSLLKDLIKQHHLLYLNLFDKNLMPKMHISIHYPDIIPEIGPLEPLSCIRMEAKHREGKQIAHSSTNRINLPYSITKRHQLKFCCRLLAGRGLSLKISFSSVQTVNVTEVKEFSKFCHIFSEDICSTKWNIVKWIKINNSHYENGTLVVTKWERSKNPQFGYIHTISVSKDNIVHFLLKKLTTVNFNTHFHAYEINFTDQWNYVKFQDLTIHTTTSIKITANGKRLVPFRFTLH